MTTPATWALGAQDQADSALADAQDAIRNALKRPATPASRALVFEDALREILSDAMSLGGRHWEAPVRMAAEALARAGNDESVALAMRWAAL